MRVEAWKWWIAGLVSVVQIPVLWALGMGSLPSVSAIRASKTADIIGVWIFTWGLIAFGMVAALVVGWICLSSALEARRSTA
jgi:hypothetical protein